MRDPEGVEGMDKEAWMRDALKTLRDEVRVGQVFEAKHLFKEHRWNQLSRGEKIQFGTHFSNEFKEGRVPNVRRIERGRNNHTRYEKVSE